MRTAAFAAILLAGAASVAATADAPADRGTIVVTTEDGSIVPLHNWSLSYEYGLAKAGTSPLFAPTARKAAWDLYVGKKPYPVTGQVLTIAYAESMRSTESDTGVKTEKIKTPREQGETALEFFTEVKSVYVDYTGQARKGSLY